MYFYDDDGLPMGMMYRNSSYADKQFDYYLYEKDVFGNIIAIYNASGTKVASYCYDAWGNCTVLTNVNGIGAMNPFRYRGYYLDTETNLYYLQSRYYDAYTGRFINADGQLNGGLLGYNLFAYCENNPVMRVDYTGTATCVNFQPDMPTAIHLRMTSGGSMCGGSGSTTPPTCALISDKLKEDINEFDIDNTDEDKVFRAHYFSAYKGKFVIVTTFDASFSFGIIGLSHIQKNSATLNHEYGHTQQLEYMGVIRYTTKVAIPSVTINILSRCGKLPYDYYGAPWEAEADRLGGVHRTSNNTPWPEGSYNSYFDLIKMFWD